jgi:hypothetical protein
MMRGGNRKMGNIEGFSQENIDIQRLLGRFLNLRPPGSVSAVSGSHIDQDSLSAFTEGKLNECEAAPVVKHLVDCSFCRHVTTELVRLDLAFANENDVRPLVEAGEPSKISSVLNGILSKIFGTTEGAVFAHNEKEEEKKEDNEENEDR